MVNGRPDNMTHAGRIIWHRWPFWMTICRHCWLETNRLRIDGYLKSAGYRLLGFSTELLESRVSLLDKLRSSRPEWLETLLRFLYNSGGFLVPV